MPEEFNWNDEESKEELVQETIRVNAIAVYINNAGLVSIRQLPDEDQDDDQIIVVTREGLPRLIARLQELQSELASRG